MLCDPVEAVGPRTALVGGRQAQSRSVLFLPMCEKPDWLGVAMFCRICYCNSFTSLKDFQVADGSFNRFDTISVFYFNFTSFKRRIAQYFLYKFPNFVMVASSCSISCGLMIDGSMKIT